MNKFFLALIACSLYTGLIGQGCVRITSVNPVTDIITITNTTGNTADLSDYRLCSLFSYTNDIENGTTIISGNPSSIPDGTAIEIQWPINNNAADLALYLPSGSFSDPTAMVDFMQYGGSGLGRESEAVQAGLWTAGTFVTNNGNMTWVGTCLDHSAGNWFSTNLSELSELSLTVAPNPVQDELTIRVENSELTQAAILIYNLNGESILNETFLLVNNQVRLNTSSWANGTYVLQLRDKRGNLFLKKIVKD
ncbi:MAG: T9SS type A sorting domain-containing protein [Bacteroidota bacterium]